MNGGGYGNPFALNVKGDNTVAAEVKQTVVKAFSECGYTVAEAGAPTLDRWNKGGKAAAQATDCFIGSFLDTLFRRAPRPDEIQR